MADPETLRRPGLDDRPLYDAIAAKYTFPTLAVSVEIGLYELLARRPCSIAQVAEGLSIGLRAAEAVLAVAAGLEFLEVAEDGRFQLAAVAETYLLRSSPFFRRDLANSQRGEVETVRRAVRSDRQPPQPFAVEMGRLPESEVQAFIEIMHAMTLPAACALADQPVFAEVRRLLDVGGGSGSLSLAIAARHPETRCAVMDLEPVCRIAERHISDLRLSDRVKVVPGDMFGEPWPNGFDCVLFGNIFHDWDWDACISLASRACEALAPQGFIALHEMLLNERKDGPLTVALTSVAMLVHEKGKQFTRSELVGLLTRAGFDDVQFTPTFGYYSLVSARKP